MPQTAERRTNGQKLQSLHFLSLCRDLKTTNIFKHNEIVTKEDYYRGNGTAIPLYLPYIRAKKLILMIKNNYFL